MNSQTLADLQATYDGVAEEYVRRIYDELQHKPLDRQLLSELAARLQGQGWICDMGCGPGHVARYLQAQGAQVLGIDLSPAMVAQARHLNPNIEFQVGNMLALEVPAEAWAGIVAFYSLIHIPRAEVVNALREFHRVLQPNGMVLVAFHQGTDSVHLSEWWGQTVSADFIFFHISEMIEYLLTAGFVIEVVAEREPYPEVEHPSQRGYIWARKATEE